MKSFLISAMLLCSSAISYAQTTPYSVVWEKSFGGAADDEAVDVVDATKGAMVVVGNSGSNNGDVSGHHGALGISDVMLTKLKPDHTVAWQHSFGGTLEDVAVKAVASSDGGVVVVGYTGSSDGDFKTNAGAYDGFVAKFDASGNTVWVKNFGGQRFDFLYGIQETSDNGFIVCGSSNSTNGDLLTLTHFGDYDAWVMKLNSDGVIEWRKTFGGSDAEEAYDIKQTKDGGYVFTGYTYSLDGAFSTNHDSSDVWVAKLSSTGTLQWQKLLGGTDDEEGDVIIQTSDNGFAICGYTTSYDGDVTDNHNIDGGKDAWLVKLDQNGGKLWTKCYGGTDDDAASDIIEYGSDHGFLLCGSTSSFDGDVSASLGPPDAWVFKTDAAGGLQWDRALGGADSDVAYGLSLVNGAPVVCGSSLSTDGDFPAVQGGVDAWVAELGQKSGVHFGSLASNGAVAFPNPFSLRTRVSLPAVFVDGSVAEVSLYNSLGVEVLRSRTAVFGGSISLERGTLRAGVYQCRVASGLGSVTAAVVVIN